MRFELSSRSRRNSILTAKNCTLVLMSAAVVHEHPRRDFFSLRLCSTLMFLESIAFKVNGSYML